MKNSSSLNLRMCELAPLLRNKIAVPVMHPMIIAVIDSLTHRFSSNKCPMTKQIQRTATNTDIGTT